MKHKSILTGLLTVMMLMQGIVMPDMQAAAADNEDTEAKAELLVALDVLPHEFMNSYSASKAVTYGAYLTAVEAMLSDNVSNDVLQTAYNYNILKYSEASDTTAVIDYATAVKAIVRAGGYSESWGEGDTVKEYFTTASKRKLLRSISLSEDDELTAKAFVDLLFNAVEAPITDYEYNGRKWTKYERDDETILSRYRKIYEIKDIVYDNGYTSLTGDTGCGEDGVIIGDVRLEKSDRYTDDLIGYNVRAFYHENNRDALELKYMYPYKSKAIEVYGEDITEIDKSFSLVTYEQGSSYTKRKIKLSPSVKVIYNGKVYYDYTAEDFKDTESRLVFIDNNDDSTYEVAVIEKYETVFVDYVTSFDNKLINKYKYDGAANNVDISVDSGDYKVIYDSNVQIQPLNVVSVATSRDPGEKVRKVYVSDETLTGTLDSVKYDAFIIDGEEYKLNSILQKARSSNDKAVPQITFGTEYTFYLDKDGRIAGIGAAAEDEYFYAVAVNMYMPEDSEEEVLIKYMDSAASWYKLNLADKVKLYDKDNAGRSMKAEAVYRTVVAGGSFIPQVVQLRLNRDNKINGIKIAVKKNTYDKDKLTVGDQITGCYRWTSRMLSSKSGPLLYIAPGAVTFLFPASLSRNEEDYGIKTSYGIDDDFTVTPYNTDEFMTSDCLVIKGEDEGSFQDELFVVKKILSQIDSEGDVKTVLLGQYGNYKDYTIMAKDNKTFDDVRKGDVLRIATDNRGRVLKKEFLYSVETGYKYTITGDYSYRAAGNVLDVDRETNSIRMFCGDGEYTFKASGNGSETKKGGMVYINDKDEGDIRIGDFSDIVIGDYVVLNVRYAEIKDVIIVRNY